MLTSQEIAFAADADMMLTKNHIIQEAYQLFGRLADTYRNNATQLPETLIRQHPKISKGENYLGLPWVMLDYPKNFNSPDIFAVRTMFWWGNYFSLQLLLQGNCLEMLNVAEILNANFRKEWFFCTGSTPWQHHFGEDYMMPVAMLTSQIIQKQKEENGFIKIGVKLPIAEWESAEAFLKQQFSAALAVLS